MHLLLDLNLSPSLCEAFGNIGHEAIHWSSVGSLTAADEVLLEYARQQDLVIVTHDLDFGALLAATHGKGPSVIIIRSPDITSAEVATIVSNAIKQFETEIADGALVTIDAGRSRARVLPIE